MQSKQSSRHYTESQSVGFDFEAVYDDNVDHNAIIQFDYDAIEGEDLSKADIKFAMEFLKRMILFLKTQSRKSLVIDCIWLATGDAANDNQSITDIARRHGITKQAVSVRVKQIQSDLKLPRARVQKSVEASKSYDVSNWRPKNVSDS